MLRFRITWSVWLELDQLCNAVDTTKILSWTVSYYSQCSAADCSVTLSTPTQQPKNMIWLICSSTSPWHPVASQKSTSTQSWFHYSKRTTWTLVSRKTFVQCPTCRICWSYLKQWWRRGCKSSSTSTTSWPRTTPSVRLQEIPQYWDSIAAPLQRPTRRQRPRSSVWSLPAGLNSSVRYCRSLTAAATTRQHVRSPGPGEGMVQVLPDGRIVSYMAEEPQLLF